MGKKLTGKKAKEILKDGSVSGKKLSEKQKKFFGAVAGGEKPRKVRGAGHQGSPFEFASTPRYKARGKLNKY